MPKTIYKVVFRFDPLQIFGLVAVRFERYFEVISFKAAAKYSINHPGLLDIFLNFHIKLLRVTVPTQL